VTRHRLNHVCTVATALWPTADLMPDVVTCNPILSLDDDSSTRHRCAAHQYRNDAIGQIRRGDSRTVPRIS
jgi:hypothetical protein